MAAYKYYARERARHSEALAIKFTREQMIEMSDALSRHFNRAPLPVYFSDTPKQDPSTATNLGSMSRTTAFRLWRHRRLYSKTNWSWFNPAGFLSYGTGMFNLLTVAHEVAHYLHDQECKSQNRKVVPHGKEHAMWVDRCVAALKTMVPAVQPAVETLSVAFTKVAGEIVEIAKDPIKAFYDSLPERLTCPCCNATLPKMNFGVRVMKRDANNIPTVIRRQSYCRTCR